METKVLVVDDDPVSRCVLQQQLKQRGLFPIMAENGEQGLELLKQHKPTICIVDWMMPGMDGLTLVKQFRAQESGEELYIIMLTAKSTIADLRSAFAAGVDDFIRKPIEMNEFTARLNAGVRVSEVQKRLTAQVDNASALNHTLYQLNQALDRTASTDALTGLLNRGAAVQRLEQLWAASGFGAGPLTCIMVDIDHFKEVNDKHGHAVGDQVLKTISQRLQDEFSRDGMVGRFGGEEFVLSFFETPGNLGVDRIDKVRKAIADNPIQAEGVNVNVTLSAGVCVSSDVDVKSLDELLRVADDSLYAAKRAGRNRVLLAQRGARASTASPGETRTTAKAG